MEEVFANLGAAFTTLFNAALDGVVIADPTGRVIHANPAALGLFGVSHQELVGTTTERFLAPGLDLSSLRRKLAQDGKLRLEMELVRPDGTRRRVETVARANFVPGRTLSILRDVTDRWTAERARSRSEERFSKAFRASPIPIVIMRSTDGRCVEVNDAFLAIAMRPREDLVGKTTEEVGIVVPGTREAVLAKLGRDGSARDVSVDILRPNGEVRHTIASIETLEIDGESSRLAVLRDVTEARAAEEARRRDAARFRALVEQSTDIVLLLDASGKILYASPGFTRVLGFPVEDWIGRSSLDLLAPEELPAARERMAKSLAQAGTLHTSVITARGAQGPVQIEATTVNRLDDPAVGAVVVNARDVTERVRAEAALRAAEEKLRHSQKMEAIGTLAGGIAHDFNNVLSVILGCVEMVLEDVPTSSIRPDLELIQGAARRAADLTNQLLAFSRKQMLQPKTVDVNSLVANFQRFLERVVAESIALDVRLGPELGTVLIDPGQFEQVLLNLATNARDAMPSGGRLVVETSNVELDDAYAAEHAGVRPGSFVCVAVSDSGVGMTPEVRARIFEPFFTTKELGRGTGLGLATLFGIVHQHGGHIWVDSEPERGTTFKLYFPRTDRASERAGRDGSAARVGGNETLLLVEDDDALRNLTKRILERAGYEVLVGAHPVAALEVAAHLGRTIHLLVTDVVMPGMNGRELAERLLASRPEVRVLYMSGYADQSIVSSEALSGGAEFLQKPIPAEPLLAKVRAMLDGAARR